MSPLALERRPDLGTLRVTGKDRVSWLNGLVTQDVSRLLPGSGAFALATHKNGKVLAELLLVATADGLLLGAARAQLVELAAHLEKHIVMERVELEDASGACGWFVLHGDAAATLGRLPRGAAGASVDTTGVGGALICAERDAAASLEAALGVPVLDDAAAEQLRLEAGVPRFGVDYDGSNYPQEAGVEGRAVSFQKGCYLGQEAVFMLQERGHAKKRLVGLRVAGEAGVERGAVVLADDAEVGTVTSCAPGPTAGERAVLAFVKHRHLEREAFSIDGRAARRHPGG